MTRYFVNHLLILSAVVIPCNAEPNTLQRIQDLLLVNKRLNLYHSKKTLCAQISLYYTLREVGCDANWFDILEKVPVGPQGTSMAAICKYLAGCNVTYQSVKTSSLERIKNIIKPGRVAILHVDNGSHFVVLKKDAEWQFVILEGTKALNIDSETDRRLRKRFSDTALITGLTKMQAFMYLVDWRPMVIFLLIIPSGLGTGALIAKLTVFSNRLRKEVISDEV